MTDTPADALFMADLAKGEAIALIDDALDEFKNQTLVAQTAIVDLLLDIRGSLT